MGHAATERSQTYKQICKRMDKEKQTQCSWVAKSKLRPKCHWTVDVPLKATELKQYTMEELTKIPT